MTDEQAIFLIGYTIGTIIGAATYPLVGALMRRWSRAKETHGFPVRLFRGDVDQRGGRS